MVNIFSIWFCSFLMAGNYVDHDIQMAQFIFNLENEANLEVVLDKEDIIKSIEIESDLVSDSPIFEERLDSLLKDYFKQHLKLVINKEHIDFTHVEIEVELEHYRLTFDLDYSNQVIEEIFIQNTCLLGLFPKHSNIITFNYQDKRRDFRMHEGRKELSIVYQ